MIEHRKGQEAGLDWQVEFVLHNTAKDHDLGRKYFKSNVKMYYVMN